MGIISLFKGQLLCREGDQGNDMYVLLKGKLQVFLRREDRKIVLAELTSGHFLGEMSLLEGEPRSADVVAVEPSELLVITKDNFKHCIQQKPELAIRIMKGLSHRLRVNNEKIIEMEEKLCRVEKKVEVDEEGELDVDSIVSEYEELLEKLDLEEGEAAGGTPGETGPAVEAGSGEGPGLSGGTGN